MIELLCFILAVLASPFKSNTRLEAENAALRHQLNCLAAQVKSRAHLTNNDRWFFTQMYRWVPSILEVLVIIRPETLVHWHRARLSPLLALEVALSGRATADRGGPARADPVDERRKFSLGRATHPRRTPQARV
jgi:hypothetical protein